MDIKIKFLKTFVLTIINNNPIRDGSLKIPSLTTLYMLKHTKHPLTLNTHIVYILKQYY